jgi:hypothetical protein
MGSAVVGSTAYLAELLVGNLAFAFIQNGISWRWAFIGIGVVFFATGVATWLFIREPPVGRFVTRSKVCGDCCLCFLALLLTLLLPPSTLRHWCSCCFIPVHQAAL